MRPFADHELKSLSDIMATSVLLGKWRVRSDGFFSVFFLPSSPGDEMEEISMKEVPM